ncbi:hypothetical protein [Thermogemmatispora carboxidivorans]|uniref:hypothetical protein n=1 Tax=Thermogemmatispora carboxidivorans TaxID=1382306 RepID=UPI0012DE39B9|nr:hypothetical protein [Thermogemmatispora carboxidivorans]
MLCGLCPGLRCLRVTVVVGGVPAALAPLERSRAAWLLGASPPFGSAPGAGATGGVPSATGHSAEHQSTGRDCSPR